MLGRFVGGDDPDFVVPERRHENKPAARIGCAGTRQPLFVPLIAGLQVQGIVRQNLFSLRGGDSVARDMPDGAFVPIELDRAIHSYYAYSIFKSSSCSEASRNRSRAIPRRRQPRTDRRFEKKIQATLARIWGEE